VLVVNLVTECGQFNDHLGDEALIEHLDKMGRLGEKVPGGPDLTDTDIRRAKVAVAKGSAAKI